MATKFTKTKAVLSDNCTVEEADEILQWLMQNQQGQVDLSKVKHLHTAAFQAIAAMGNPIVAPPADPFYRQALSRLGRI